MRHDSTLPEGYVSRRGQLALCIKIHRGPTAEELASVADDLAVKPEDTTGPLKRDGTGQIRGGPWGPSWFEAFACAEPEEYGTLHGFALDDALEHAQEVAAETFPGPVELYTDGRSGGWLTLHGTYTPDDAKAALEAVSYADTGTMPESGDVPTPEEIDEARSLLAALEYFRAYVAVAVADFPRAVAWQVCANAFLPAAEEHAQTVARDEARARLERAVTAMRNVARSGSRQVRPAFQDVAMLDAIASDLTEVVAEYDAARAALAKIEVSDLSGTCSECDEDAPLRDSGICGACENDKEGGDE